MTVARSHDGYAGRAPRLQTFPSGPRKFSHVQTSSDSGSPRTSAPPLAISARASSRSSTSKSGTIFALWPAEIEIAMPLAEQLDLVTVLGGQLNGAHLLERQLQAQGPGKEPDRTRVLFGRYAQPGQSSDAMTFMTFTLARPASPWAARR